MSEEQYRRMADALPEWFEHDGKADGGKPRVELVPMAGVLGAAEVMTAALRENGGKYDEGSWRTVPNARRRYLGGLLRHAFAVCTGGLNAVDDESGHLHIKHVVCNALFLAHLAATHEDPK